MKSIDCPYECRICRTVGVAKFEFEDEADVALVEKTFNIQATSGSLCCDQCSRWRDATKAIMGAVRDQAERWQAMAKAARKANADFIRPAIAAKVRKFANAQGEMFGAFFCDENVTAQSIMDEPARVIGFLMKIIHNAANTGGRDDARAVLTRAQLLS